MEIHDDQLDAALGALRTRLAAAVPHDLPGELAAHRVRPVDDVLAGAREQLLAATARRRRWPAVAAAAAVVLVLVAAGLLVSTAAVPATAAAKDTLTRAASASIGSSDEPLGPGQYRFVGTRAWYSSEIGGVSDTPLRYLRETFFDVWMPADPTEEWLLDRGETGRRQWIQGSDEAARAAGVSAEGLREPGERITARCGDFYPSPEFGDLCTTPGSWQVPNAAFFASMHRDPVRLLERLKADAPDNSRGDAELLVYAADALRSGIVPADVRSALYLALSRIDGLTVTDGAVNLDGRTGTALGIDDSLIRQEIIVDPATGVFIGEREVSLGPSLLTRLAGEGVPPAGTVLSFTAVRTAVVDAIGERPAG